MTPKVLARKERVKRIQWTKIEVFLSSRFEQHLPVFLT